MRHDRLRVATLVALATASGWIGWSGHALLLPASLIFPLLWGRSPSRLSAILVSAGYFLAASRGLPHGVATYYGSDLWPGILLWVVASAGFVVVHGTLWTTRPAWRPLRYLLAAILMAVPPFGVVGWAHPITAAGVLFPGWGWFGVAAMTAGLAGLASRLGPAVAIGLLVPWLWSAATWTDANLAEPWRGVDLVLGASLGRDAGLQRQHDLLAAVRSADASGHGVIILPESALGFWTSTIQHLWERELVKSSTVVLAGATVVTPDGYDNVLVSIGPAGSRIAYQERMPVPGSMWQPWRSWLGLPGGTQAHFFANPAIDLVGKRVAPLICYEQLITWPVLQSMIFHPDVIVAVGNGRWTAGTSIVAIQRASTTAWARLFSLPLIMSFNT